MKRETERPWYMALRSLGLSVLAANLLVFAPLAAQDEEAKAEEETDIVVLSEFRVDESQEYGYRATSSATAIRLAAQ